MSVGNSPIFLWLFFPLNCPPLFLLLPKKKPDQSTMCIYASLEALKVKVPLSAPNTCWDLAAPQSNRSLSCNKKKRRYVNQKVQYHFTRITMFFLGNHGPALISHLALGGRIGGRGFAANMYCPTASHVTM